MLDSLYGRLFKYRQSEFRSPLEDYLSECLADLFNRLPLPMQGKLSTEFVPKSRRAALEKAVSAARTVRMEVQQWIPSGRRTDLVIQADGVPLVAIESKVSALLRDGQLSDYGAWIREAGDACGVCTICLLTHLTKAPVDFFSGGPGSGGAAAQVVSWGTVSRAVRDISTSEEVPPDTRMLAGELFEFLGENGMSTEFAERDDFAAAMVFLRSGSRMHHTFRSIYDHVRTRQGCFARARMIGDHILNFDSQSKLIWGWKFVQHPTFGGLFFGYGMALDPGTTMRQGRIPSRDSVFLCLGAEEKGEIQALRASASIPTAPWTYAEIANWVAIISFRPLSDFLEEPEGFAPKMKAWIDENADDVDEFVRKLR